METLKDFAAANLFYSAAMVAPRRSAVKEPKVFTWRRSGQTQTWKRDPERFRIPVKYGLYESNAITDTTANIEFFLTPEDAIASLT